jgi:cytochrome c biogenesis protein CcmG/thiol:disulfide interchange protein DsbE
MSEAPAPSPSRALLLLAAAFFLLAAVIVAYSLGQRSSIETVPRTVEGPDQAAAPRLAPLFSLPSLRGPERISLADFDGRAVILNFFASWCRPCELEAADLERTWQANKDSGVVFLGIAIQDEAGAARAFLQKHGVSYPAAIDTTGEVMQAYRVTGIPTTFFIAGDRRITGQHAGIFIGDEGVARLQERINRAKEGSR